MVVAECDVIPFLRSEELARQLRAAVLHGAPLLAQTAIHAVREQHVDGRAARFGPQRRTFCLCERLLRHREHGAIELGQDDAACFFDRDFHTQRLVQPQDRARLRRSRGVVLSGNRDDGRRRQAAAEAMQLAEEEEDRGIRRPDRMENVAGNDDQLGLLLEQVVHHPAERLRDVRLALVRTPWRLPVELAEPEVKVGEVRELHCKRIVV